MIIYYEYSFIPCRYHTTATINKQTMLMNDYQLHCHELIEDCRWGSLPRIRRWFQRHSYGGAADHETQFEAFCAAAVGGHIQVLSHLLDEQHFYINLTNKLGYTPLFVVCLQKPPFCRNQNEVISFLIQRGANLSWEPETDPRYCTRHIRVESCRYCPIIIIIIINKTRASYSIF